MAAISNIVSALTQGNEDFFAAYNTAQITTVTTPLPSADWTRVFRFTDNDSNGALAWRVNADNLSAPSANYLIYGFYIYLEDITPTLEYRLFCVGRNFDLDPTTNTQVNASLILETDGDLRLVDTADSTVATATSPFTASTWHRVEVRVIPGTPSGEVQVWVDGTDIYSGNQTVDTGSSAYADIAGAAVMGSDAETGDVFVYFAGAYCMMNSTAASDRLDSDFEVIGPYQNTAITGATPDAGNNLDGNGTNWATTQEIPFSDETPDTDAAEYDGTPLSGTIHYDAGTRSGPNGDSRIDGTSNIKAWKGIWRLQRGNGSGTTHTCYLGDDGATFSSGFDSMSVSLSTAWGNFSFVTDTATNMPTSTDYFSQGVGVNGARNLYIAEMAAFVLHVPAAALSVPNLTMSPRLPT